VSFSVDLKNTKMAAVVINIADATSTHSPMIIYATMHPDTQAIFTSVASFNALTKSDTIPRQPGSSLQRAASNLFPKHTTVIGQYYFRFEHNNDMNAMETIDGEPCICV
jgi:hypothetical protein